MGKILTSKNTLEQWGDLFYAPATGEAYRETPPIFGDDEDPQSMRMLSGGREPRLTPIWIPLGFFFERATQMLPGDPKNPESPLTGQAVPPWNFLQEQSAVSVIELLRPALSPGASVTTEHEAGLDHFEVTPLPLGLVINQAGTVTKRNAGMVAKALSAGVYYDEMSGSVMQDYRGPQQRLHDELAPKE